MLNSKLTWHSIYSTSSYLSRNLAKVQINMLYFLYLVYGHLDLTMLNLDKISYTKLKKNHLNFFSYGMMHRALLYADLVTRPLAANGGTKMAALGGIAGSENRRWRGFKRKLSA